MVIIHISNFLNSNKINLNLKNNELAVLINLMANII